MNKLNKNLILKGQLNSCPLLFVPILLAFLLTILCPACSKKTEPPVQQVDLFEASAQRTSSRLSDINKSQVQVKKPHYKTFVNQAKNIDLTTPVGFKLIKSDSSDNVSFFMYQGKQNLEKIISFYMQELEIAGWDFKNLSTKQEGLFVCNKWSKKCVISIRAQSPHSTTICITLAVTNRD